ncbi:MAG: 2-hydroxychromene-2-carboxylate isomerase [Undibacterium sp.]|uniref:2-hydroxychromene-2-carboxylate isomerase n=1 Tax=Undibacterium sp. TaxID=1914977 RepID=UPI00271F5366|nr:2-hydroxychromene-2-carboxylate isomerase [Undibacterium sp.]MDO8652113.1 2-hydroxychromene-2-carboxylate isomerase [Undibacterium sp.]
MKNTDTRTATLEFWFEFASNYSYLTVMRIDALAAEYGVAVVWKPFLLGPVFKSFGWNNSPFVLQKEKGAYVWQDMTRQCKKYRLPWTRPTDFPRASLLPMRVALVGAEQPWMSEYCQRIMQINFVEDRPIDHADVVNEVLTSLNLPASDILLAAQSEENKRRLRLQTEQAHQRGIFGAPTFFVGTDMFWGNDRLEDALIFAAQSKHQT